MMRGITSQCPEFDQRNCRDGSGKGKPRLAPMAEWDKWPKNKADPNLSESERTNNQRRGSGWDLPFEVDGISSRSNGSKHGREPSHA